MPDPFDLLHTALVAAEPDPVFATRLRARLSRALDLPKGVTVSNLTGSNLTGSDLTGSDPTAPNVTASDLTAGDPSGGVPARADPNEPGLRHGDIGYVSLWLPDVEKAATFFSSVLGWRYAPASGSQGRRVEGLTLHHGLWGGVDPPTLFCCFTVADIDTAIAQVVAAGGSAQAPRAEPFGLVSECTDDQGVRFAIFQRPSGVDARRPMDATGVREGDLAYVTMEVVDSARARSFYGNVLGWRFSSGHVDDGWQVNDVAPMVGVSGGHQAATTVPLYRVDDIAAAVERVRTAGGTATDPELQPYGITANCTDDQGTRFYLGQLSP